jgi:hypothetical protein
LRRARLQSTVSSRHPAECRPFSPARAAFLGTSVSSLLSFAMGKAHFRRQPLSLWNVAETSNDAVHHYYTRRATLARVADASNLISPASGPVTNFGRARRSLLAVGFLIATNRWIKQLARAVNAHTQPCAKGSTVDRLMNGDYMMRRLG